MGFLSRLLYTHRIPKIGFGYIGVMQRGLKGEMLTKGKPNFWSATSIKCFEAWWVDTLGFALGW